MIENNVLVDIVKIRRANSRNSSSVIITLPQAFVEKYGLTVGEKKRIYTDGKKICIDDIDKPKL